MSTVYRPLSRIRRHRKPWALVTVAGPDWLKIVTGEGDVHRSMARETNAATLEAVQRTHVVFTDSPVSLARATDATRWTYRVRRGRLLDARRDGGPRVVKIPLLPPGDEGLSGFGVYLRHLEGFGVWPTSRSSWSTLGKHLWASTLDRSVRFSSEIGRRGFLGARKDAPFPGRYTRTAYYDVVSAYPHALAAAPVPHTLRLLGASRWGIVWDEERDGVAFASVNVSHDLDAWPPLPTWGGRDRTNYLSWSTGRVEGWWTFRDLRAAVALGSDVDLLEVWGHPSALNVFEAWGEIVNAGRALPGVASTLAKSHANALWSSFAAQPHPIVTKRWTDPYALHSKRVHWTRSTDRCQDSAFVSAIVSGRVRAQVLLEGLADPDRHAIYVDTDGIIAAQDRLPEPSGSTPGQWREVRRMRSLDVRCPGAYRWTCDDCGASHARWHYSVAGASTRAAAAARFDERSRSRTDDSLPE